MVHRIIAIPLWCMPRCLGSICAYPQLRWREHQDPIREPNFGDICQSLFSSAHDAHCPENRIQLAISKSDVAFTRHTSCFASLYVFLSAVAIDLHGNATRDACKTDKQSEPDWPGLASLELRCGGSWRQQYIRRAPGSIVSYRRLYRTDELLSQPINH